MVKKSIYLVILFFLTSCFSSVKKTNINKVNKQLFGENTWTNNIYVNETIEVMPNATLNIEPGTTVVFSEGDLEGKKLRIIVKTGGQILAKGTGEKPIVFTGEGKRKTNKSWEGIIFKKSKESVFQFTRFLFCNNPIRAANTDIMIYQSLFRFCNHPVYFDGGDVRIVSSSFEKSSTAISFKNAVPKIVRNTFLNNKRAVYFMENSARGIVHENNFLKNFINIEISESEKNVINLVQNFWGTHKKDEINQKIRYNKYFVKGGRVMIVPFAYKLFKFIENPPN